MRLGISSDGTMIELLLRAPTPRGGRSPKRAPRSPGTVGGGGSGGCLGPRMPFDGAAVALDRSARDLIKAYAMGDQTVH